MKILFLTLISILSFSSAQESGSLAKSIAPKNKSSTSFEICSEFMNKNGLRFQLGQVWFSSGDNAGEAKQLSNYTVDYNDKPFAHHFSFKNLPKEKLWLDCVYFGCGDAICSSENASSDPETIHHEMKEIPVSCKSKVKMGNPTKIESFKCKYENKNQADSANHNR
jgi:hypothetical protein